MSGMSGLGQTRSSSRDRARSAVPPTADKRRLHQHVGFVPTTDSCAAANRTLIWITSSALAKSVGGTTSPSAFSVLRLIADSHFVGDCTRRSAGFAPKRIAGKATITHSLVDVSQCSSNWQYDAS